jgi:hypothetical protein
MSNPAKIGEIVIFGADDGYLTGIGQDDGELRWSVDISSPIASGPVISAGKAYFGDSDGNLHCHNALNGFESWSIGLPESDDISSSPAVADMDDDGRFEIFGFFSQFGVRFEYRPRIHRFVKNHETDAVQVC